MLRAEWVLSCRRMTPSLNMIDRLRRMASRWPRDYPQFPKLKEHISGTRFSSDSDVKHLPRTGSMGWDVISTKPVLRSDKYLNRFSD
ncbi:hypothetical protein AVEN_134388-1 [Araneus ventricosus]|uniref:Uncharacterized protein n=1 Tax=Araneus ventricosus TaxID=182803 RepID=A0A4Y2JC45_ARAVE|nr:hypothetical protein AVEN_134388-1 [Araneus ventricosus]